MASSNFSPGLTSRQPFKGLYVLFSVLYNAAKLPWWLIYFLPRSLRQNPSYSYKMAVRTEILRNVLHTQSAIRVITPMRLGPGRDIQESTRIVRFDPSKDRTAAAEGGRYTGVVSMDTNIRPTTMYGVWYSASPTAESLERLRVDEKAPPLILHFHGGAYAIGDPRPEYSGYLGNLFSRKLGPTLCASYRLASNPHGTFPAALQDAITAYSHVVSVLGVPAKRVVLSGDSAGANLVLALLRYISRYPEAGLDAPGAALLWSPWLDLSTALDERNLHRSRNRKSDYLTPNFASWGASSMRPANGLTNSEVVIDGPWLSPGLHPFSTTTPVWMQGGGLEVLIDDIAKFAQEMRKIKGNHVGFYVEEIASHDVVLAAPILGLEAAASNVAEKAGAWLKETL